MAINLEFEPDPDNPGWQMRRAGDAGLFLDTFGTLRYRAEPDGRVRCRVHPASHHRNLNGNLHGGFIMAWTDQAMYLALRSKGIAGGIGGFTVDATTQFFGPLRIDKPVDAVVDLLRETRRLIFMRGLLEQDGVAAVAFSGTVRRAPADT